MREPMPTYVPSHERDGAKVPFLRRVMQVPDSWEGWAMRILTVFLAIVLVAVWALTGQMADLAATLENGRSQRVEFQQQELARQCAILERLGVTDADRVRFQC